MATSKNINSYVDVRGVMEQMLAGKGGEVTLASEAAATRFRQRCYAYRKLLAELVKERLPLGQAPSTIYDEMRITKEGPKLIFAFGNEFVLSIRTNETPSVVPHQPLIEVPDASDIPDEDELLAAIKGLGLRGKS